ncbi:MAG: hypothetical protein ABJL72_17415 [Roseobacter sp.]
MIHTKENRGGSPVGFINELDGIEAASVIYLRLWGDSAESKSSVWNDFAASLGSTQSRNALKSFEDLCRMCGQHGRRPLVRHAVGCKCVGSDEACFANFIRTASLGDRNDAMLIATLLVRPDIAPMLTALAMDFGLALRRMNLSNAHETTDSTPEFRAHQPTLH